MEQRYRYCRYYNYALDRHSRFGFIVGQVLLLSLCVLTNGLKIKNMYPDRVLRF